MNVNQRLLTIKPGSTKFESHKYSVKRHDESADEHLESFQQLVINETKKCPNLTWNAFFEKNDLSRFFNVFDSVTLKQNFQSFHSSGMLHINENLMRALEDSFKKLIMKFVQPLVMKHESNRTSIVNELLNDPQFLIFFQETNLPYGDAIKDTNCDAHLDYLLPNFFINFESPHNKLSVIDYCIKEIQNQKRLAEFSREFLTKLEMNSDLYLDMSFNDIAKQFKNEQWWNEFGSTAKSIFNEFVSSATKRFKEVFDERLLELSFIIYSVEPMKGSCPKNIQNKKSFGDNLLDMNFIKSIDKKIFFQNKWFNKAIFRKYRIKWIVKYMGSILSMNPNQCYIFDFNSEECCQYMSRYALPFTDNVNNFAAVISGDDTVDHLWRENMIDTIEIKKNLSDSTELVEIQFIPSTTVKLSQFWKNHFSSCQKVIFLISRDSLTSSDTLNRLINEEMVNNVQLSVINLAKTSVSTKFIDEVTKRYNIEYSNIGWSLCPGQYLKKLLNEQTNYFLFNSKPIVIWIIGLCGDTYDTSIPLSFILSIFQEYIVTDRNNLNGILSITIHYTHSNMKIPQSITFSILSYHQAYKFLTEGIGFKFPSLLMYFCNLCRLGSINTMFAVLHKISVIVHVKAVMCAIFNLNDPVEVIDRICMIKRLAAGSNVDYLIIEDNKEIDEPNNQRLWMHIENCVAISHHLEVNNYECDCHNACENDNNLDLSKLKINDGNCEKSKEIVNYGQGNKELKTVKCLTQSPKHIQSYLNVNEFLDISLHSDKYISSTDIRFADSDYTIPLGNFHEELFKPVTEETKFNDIKLAEDKITIIYVNCSNSNHFKEALDKSKMTRSYKKLKKSKMRSYSGPIVSNKSFNKKCSTQQSQENRSQRLTKKSQSLTASPFRPAVKTFLHFDDCKPNGTHCFYPDTTKMNTSYISVPPAKSFKNMLSRLFSSERYNKQSSEDTRNLFRRSIKFTKRNSDRKSKITPIKSGSDLYSISTLSDSIYYSLSKTNSHSISEKSENLLYR